MKLPPELNPLTALKKRPQNGKPYAEQQEYSEEEERRYSEPVYDLSPGGQYGGFAGSGPEPTPYLKEVIRFDDFLDYMFHTLRGDTKQWDHQNQSEYWVANPYAVGQIDGPPMTDAGLRRILATVAPYLSKFATHSNLTRADIDSYTYRATKEVLRFIVLHHSKYQIQWHARDRVLDFIESMVHLNLSRTIGGEWNETIRAVFQAREGNAGSFGQPQVNGISKYNPFARPQQ